MPWLRENNYTHIKDTVLHEKDFSYFQLLLENDSQFMNLNDDAPNMTAEDKMKFRKARLLQIARKDIMDSVRCAMETLEEYAEDLIKITAPREKVIDEVVKTYQGWQDSMVDYFSRYVKEGDTVDEKMAMYFAEVVPPETFDSHMIQCGEPYDGTKEGFRYHTFVYVGKNEAYGELWQYKGVCLSGTTDKGTEIYVV